MSPPSLLISFSQTVLGTNKLVRVLILVLLVGAGNPSRTAGVWILSQRHSMSIIPDRRLGRGSIEGMGHLIEVVVVASVYSSASVPTPEEV